MTSPVSIPFARLGLRAISVLTLVGLLSMLLGPTLVRADEVRNNVVAGGNDTITAGGSTTITYYIQVESNDGNNGCNAADGSSMTLSFPSISANVNASPSSLTFTKCGQGNGQSVTFSSSIAASYPIQASIADAGTGTYTNSANFTLTVTAPAPPPNTAPTISVPANMTVEGNALGGANVSFVVTANDTEQGDLTGAVSCTSGSGALFPLGTTTVSCSVMDNGGLTASGSFSVTVIDTTAPSVSVPTSIAAEATSAAGASVSFSGESAYDTVWGVLTPTCAPASGSTFALGVTTVTCSATDGSGKTGSSSFTVTVQDTTAPILALPADQTVEATSANGAVATYTASADDLVDSAVTPSCSPASGSTFALGPTTVNCSATDAALNTANGSFTVTVQDTTKPALTVPANITEEATGPSGAAVSFTVSAIDAVDSNPSVTCDATSGDIFPLGLTTVSCSATDGSNNTANGSFTITVQDTTKPAFGTLTNITVDPTSATGAAVTFTAPTASDAVSGVITGTCRPPSGSTFVIGTTTVTCTAQDAAGNVGSATFTVTVNPLTFSGFFSPVDMGITNTLKGGNAVPLKFRVFAGSTELTDASLFMVKYIKITCGTNPSVIDEVEVVTTGATSLRYENGQFITNWKTPTGSACYKVVVTLNDGTTVISPVAYFQTRK